MKIDLSRVVMKAKGTILFLFILVECVVANAQELTVSQIKENTYAVWVNAFSKKDKLTWTAFPDSWNGEKSLALKKSQDSLVISSAHPVLKLTRKKRIYYFAPRAVELQGAINFRDLGGYSTNDGRQVKWGKIYRSADISKITDKDLDIISSLNIKMVCDLRGEKEVETAPDRIPSGTQRILLSAGSENIGGSASYLKYLKNPQRSDSMIMAIYKRTDHLGKKYKPMFDQLLELETDHALMFHCTAGKDRTGVGAALILYSLGVDQKIIFEDYELTNLYRKEANEKFVKMLSAQGLSDDAARNLMAAKPEYLRTAFDAIKKEYGSIDLFLEKEMGLNADKRKTLKSKFLY